MKEFSLDLKSNINGIYLNSETIELLSIIQCKNITELQTFVTNCSQLKISETDILRWNENDIDDIKRKLVEQYKSTLIPMEQSIKDRKSVLRATLEHSGIIGKEVDSYISIFQKGGYKAIKDKLKIEHPKEYKEFAEKAHRFIASERDQMKNISYEELCTINNNMHNHNTILIGAGRYYDVTNKMYDEQIPDMNKYDFYYAKRGLDFCNRNGINARYHTLLDKQTLEEHLKGQNKGNILKELQEYAKASIDFISKYNEEHKVNGKGTITSVDLFNEIISFDEPYRNMWQELYGISTEELAGVFQYAQEHRPEGVTYVYNEPFLESSDRRSAVINQLKEINSLFPGLIDTIGTQMHIEMTQNVEEIKQCFVDLKQLEELGIRTQITEFDMGLPERFMFDEKGKISEKYSPKFIYDFKFKRMQEISKAISETGIDLEGVTYWSISDTLDHNLERTNRKTYEQGLQREVAHTRYAGLYSALERTKTKSTQSLGKETLKEQKDTQLLDEIEQLEQQQYREIISQKEENTHDIQE